MEIVPCLTDAPLRWVTQRAMDAINRLKPARRWVALRRPAAEVSKTLGRPQRPRFHPHLAPGSTALQPGCGPQSTLTCSPASLNTAEPAADADYLPKIEEWMVRAGASRCGTVLEDVRGSLAV